VALVQLPGDRAARHALVGYRHTTKQIADFLGLHYSTLSVIIRCPEEQIR